MKNIIKIMGIVLACIAILLITRSILTRDSADAPEKGEQIATVLDINKIEIPDIDQEKNDSYTIIINDNKTFFSDEEIRNAKETGYYVSLSDLDQQLRAQTATMCADRENIRTEDRESDISKLTPTGWHRNSIYERCHLLMWKLSGPDDLKNLITGTEYFNQVLMLEYETQVTGYLWDHPGNHVLYRVTPYYNGKDLVAKGVLMEAESLEDDGLEFCVFVYNAQPGSVVEYDTGAYHMYESWREAAGIEEETNID